MAPGSSSKASSRSFGRKTKLSSEVDPSSSVGQFSFVPTTQTTVVTTTTTTTTSFPPIILRPPRHLGSLDPKEYPLASSPTPPVIKRFCFDLNGQPTYFRESDDPNETMSELQNLITGLEDGHGTIKIVERDGERHQHGSKASTFPSRRIVSGGSTRKRPASPVSLVDANEKSQSAQKSKRRLTVRQSADFTGGRITRQRSKESTTNNPSSRLSEISGFPTRPLRSSQGNFSQEHHNTPSAIVTLGDVEMQHHPSKTEAQAVLFTPTEHEAPLLVGSSSRLEEGSRTTSIVTPGLAEPHPADVSPIHNTRASSEGSINPPSTQPLSLPSPSLSPVTAALNHASTHGDYFPMMDSEDDDTLTSPLDISRNEGDLEMEDVEGEIMQSWKRPLPIGSSATAASIMQLPQIVDTFDAMPQALKTYLMYQFLRRCDKNTLQFVAEVVNPALKCDFLSRLPTELSLNIIKYLDYKSLSNAAQVSKKWRILIDSDEWTWKRLFETDGYCLAEGELERAVREGWGYQDPEGYLDCERDIQINLSNCTPNSSSSIISSTRKRKNTRLSARKSQKQRQTVESLGKDEFNELINELSSNEGFAAAVHAASSNPPPGVGLPSLTNLHLYKSIYRRHHIIRNSWIRPDIKPRHISFRGHQRHVVTCLQFDTDKILTGSDDTNINVYDTNTGALLNKLEGHEGGVWALQYYHNTLVSGSTDRTVRVWDIEKGECTQVFHGHTSTVRCLQILLPTQITTKDGKSTIMPKQPLIITGSRDSTLKIWKLPLKTDKPYLPSSSADLDSLPPNPFIVRTLQGHQHSVRAIAAYADTLVSGSYDNFVRVWKISTGECVHRLAGHTAKVYSVVLDHVRNRCISGSMDNYVKVWSLDTGTLLYTLEGHTSLVGLLDLSHDYLVSAAADASLRIWDPETGNLRHTLSAHTGAITCFQHDGHKVISGSDGTLKMWNVKTGQFIRDLLTNLSGVWQVRFNERRCVAAVQRENVTFIEVLDFGAARDGVPEDQRGRRIVVNSKGVEVDPSEVLADEQ